MNDEWPIQNGYACMDFPMFSMPHISYECYNFCTTKYELGYVPDIQYTRSQQPNF